MGRSSMSRAAAAVVSATLLALSPDALAEAPDLRATQLTPAGASANSGCCRSTVSGSAPGRVGSVSSLSSRHFHRSQRPDHDMTVMTTGHVYIALSLDGFIARPDGGLDWLMKQPTDGEDYGYEAFMASVDGLVMGSGSFETVLTFPEWPYAKPVVVLSRTLGSADIPDHLVGRVRVSDASPPQIMRRLASEGWRRAYVDGGRIVQSFLRNGLICDLTLTRIPILLGHGRPLFGPLDHDIDLKHLETKAFPSGLVQSRYQIADG